MTGLSVPLRTVTPVLYWTAPAGAAPYTGPVTSHAGVRRRPGEHARSGPIGRAAPDLYAELERMKHLQERLARSSVNSRRHRELTAAIRIEAAVYRKSLDAGQTAALHDSRPRPATGSGSLIRTSPPRKPASARRTPTGPRH
jgi:hypothetical protein